MLLSAKAGLRACEISALSWDMLLNPQGQLGTVIELRDSAAKKGSGRLIPIHPDLAKALLSFARLRPTATMSSDRSAVAD